MSTPRRQTKAQLRATSAAGWAVKHGTAMLTYELFGIISNLLARTHMMGSAGETKARIMTLCSREQASQRKVMDETLEMVARWAQGEQK